MTGIDTEKGVGRAFAGIWAWLLRHKLLVISSAVLVFFLVRWLLPPHVRPAPKELVVIPISVPSNRTRDIVFLHGLNGTAGETWNNGAVNGDWLKWLGKQYPDLGVWAIDYDANASDWLGGTMPVTDRAKNLLEQLRLNGIGKNPLVFVGHSLGGIVIKQMLRDAYTMHDAGWEQIGKNTKGVVFLATPHTGSYSATLLNYARLFSLPTITVQELRPNTEVLRDLNTWYRNDVPKRGVKTSVLYESLPVPTPPIIIVDEGSSDPGINGVTPIRVDANHKTICKPRSTNDLVYKSVSDFVNLYLLAAPKPLNLTFSQFIEEFNAVRFDPQRLQSFKESNVGKLVSWQAVILKTKFPEAHNGDAASPGWVIGASEQTPWDDQVYVNVLIADFDKSLRDGTAVEVVGVLDSSTNLNHAFLSECKVTRKASK